MELHGLAGAANIMLQVTVKLVFDVEDVPGFVAAAVSKGREFGPILKGDGYVFSNAKDPDGNSIPVSSRANRRP